ncbi:PPE domain-containing protein [Lentzea tibetensis]|uniref:PPE domain-containing protein n=1 Tax=Lentzea tibetensis TaxID=2591470 RepID=A0A563EZN0_9PSEU|nr:PPE domain-containing protein [Lentzea tibetensis]TWP53083.1 PPE domain-containing protein [Lentzea tibetensis]
MSDHRWRGYPHEQLHAMINGGPGVSASHELERKWKKLADSLTRIDDDLNKALGKVGADWEGSTAEATTAALSPLAQWAADAAQGSEVMKSSAVIQADNIADARKKMPEPLKVTTEAPSGFDIALGAMTGPFGAMDVINQQQDHERQEAAQENAQQQAIKVMEDYESESTWNRETLGTFNEPPQVVIDTPPPSGTTDPNANVGYSHGQTSGFSSGNTGTTNTSWTEPPSGPPAHQTGTVNQPPTDGTKTSWADPKPQPPVNPPTTLPPAPIDKGGQPPIKGGGPVLPPIFTRPEGSGAGRGPGGGGAGRGPGGPGGKPFGSMSGSLAGGSKGMPGMSGPGGMAGAMDDGHHPANRGGAAGAAGKGGAAGAGAGGAGGRGQGQGEEDIEHQTADYLVETEDVFGDERLVAPPVIGGSPEA